MIFKTFDNDIDKWTAKIGIFGKSFNDLGKTIKEFGSAVNNAFESAIDNINNFDENVGFWESLKNNLFSKKDNNKDWIKNSLGEIISQENIDSYIAELNLDSAKEKLTDIFDWEELVNQHKKSWQEYFGILDDGEKYIVDLIKNTDDLSKLTGEDLVKANQQARASALAHNEAIKAQTLSAKAGSVALKALSIAGNMLVMWAISEGLKLAVNWIDQMIHSSEYAEKAFNAAIDSAKSFSDAIKNTKKDTADMESSVKSIAKRYAELSQGVNSFTNENISLSLDDYEEFLDLNEQLAGLFPSLTRDYDDNGKAILGLSGSVDSVTESIRALVEQEKELARASIRENLEQYFNGTDEADGAWRAIKGRKKELEDVGEEIDSLTNIYNNLINSDEKITIGRFGDLDKNFAEDCKKEYIDYIKNTFGEDIAAAVKNVVSVESSRGLLGEDYDLTVDFSKLGLTETQKAQITKSYDTFYSELLAKQNTAMSEFDSQNSEFSNNAMLWLEDLSFYKESDPYVQTAIRNLVSDIDWSTYNPKELDYAGVKRILQDSILTPFQVACGNPNSKEKLTEAFKNLFTLNLSDMPVNDISSQVDSYVKTIASILGVKDLLELKIKLGFEDVTDVSQRLQNSLYQLSGDHGIHRVIDAELIDITSEFTRAQAEFWLEHTLGAQNAAEAIQMYNKALADAKKLDESTPLSISETVEQIDKNLRPAFSSLQSAYQEIFTIDEDTGKERFTHLDEAEITDKFKPILDTLQELDEIKGIHVDYSIYEDFVSVLSDTSSTADEVHEQFNRLATDIIYTSNCTNMSAETFNLLAESLSEMGVTNAYEILNNILDLQKSLADEGINVDAAMSGEAEALKEFTFASDETAEKLRQYLIQKELTQNPLNTTDDIEQLEELCDALGITGEMYQAVNTLKAAMDEKQRGAYDYDIDNTIAYYQEKIKDLASGYGDYFNFDFDSANSKLSSSSKDTHKQKYEKELQELEHAHDMGLHSDEEYWQARINLNEKYFGESSGMHQKYLDEYRDAEEAILGGIKNLWKDYYDQRKSELKDLISYAQELYDKEIDSLDASIEKLEERRDTEKMYWQDQIDALGDEIDALQEANDEKQRAIDLQNKQYQLQKAMHQRTMLIYSESRGLHYATDDKAVRDAKNDLDDAENDNRIEGLKKQQKDLQKQLDTILETYDSQIESIEKQIDSLNKVKSAWSEIVNNQELKELEERLKSIFGDDVKEKILSGNTDFINGIVSQYSDTSEILKTIEDATLTDIQNMISQYGVLPENLMYALNESIPNVTADMHEIVDTAMIAASEVSHVADAINDIPESKDVTISIHTVDDSGTMASRVLQAANLGNAYASGTKRAQKGIAVVGEEKPEVVITNNKKVLLAEHPTLLNLEGGETVFDGDATEKMLKARGLRRITPDELPLLKALTQYSSSEITQRFTPNITSPANAILSSAMQNASHAVTNNSAIQPSYTMGDVHIHCPGITKDEVVKQIGTELTNVFNGMSLKAYQRANITR